MYRKVEREERPYFHFSFKKAKAIPVAIAILSLVSFILALAAMITMGVKIQRVPNKGLLYFVNRHLGMYITYTVASFLFFVMTSVIAVLALKDVYSSIWLQMVKMFTLVAGLAIFTSSLVLFIQDQNSWSSSLNSCYFMEKLQPEPYCNPILAALDVMLVSVSISIFADISLILWTFYSYSQYKAVEREEMSKPEAYYTETVTVSTA